HYDSRIGVGRQRIGDVRLEIRDGERFERTTMKTRRGLLPQFLQRPAIPQLLPPRQLRPFRVRRLAQQTRDHACGGFAFLLQLARGGGEFGDAGGVGLALAAVEGNELLAFAHCTFPFSPYSVSARRRHLAMSFCAYFGLTPRRSATSMTVHPSKYRVDSISRQRGLGHSIASRAASWLVVLPWMRTDAGSTRSSFSSVSGATFRLLRRQ